MYKKIKHAEYVVLMNALAEKFGEDFLTDMYDGVGVFTNNGDTLSEFMLVPVEWFDLLKK